IPSHEKSDFGGLVGEMTSSSITNSTIFYYSIKKVSLLVTNSPLSFVANQSHQQGDQLFYKILQLLMPISYYQLVRY
ncbi:hypothetical protein HN873_019979, partial [Arachis hypogaea]